MSFGPLIVHGPYCPFIHVAGTGDRGPWRLPSRRLPFYLLVASCDGAEQIRVDDRSYEVPAGGSYLIPPGALHDLGSTAGNCPAWIHFDVVWSPHRSRAPMPLAYDTTVDPAFRQPDPWAVWGVDLPVLVPPALARHAAQSIPAIVRAWCEGDGMAVARAHHELAGLVLDWVHAVGPHEPGDELERRLRSAEAAARMRLAEGIGVAGMAAAAGLSRSRFHQVFSRRRGMAPGHWLREQRLTAARRLLARQELSVDAVAALVGYGDATAFGRAFAQAEGSPPGAWRRR